MEKIKFELYTQSSNFNPDYEQKMVALLNNDESVRMVMRRDKSELVNYLIQEKYIDMMDSIFGVINLEEVGTKKKFDSIDDLMNYWKE
jgi:hypothetical protein